MNEQDNTSDRPADEPASFDPTTVTAVKTGCIVGVFLVVAALIGVYAYIESNNAQVRGMADGLDSMRRSFKDNFSQPLQQMAERPNQNVRTDAGHMPPVTRPPKQSMPNDVRRIMDAARTENNAGWIDFYGFHGKMSETEAARLAAYYGFQDENMIFETLETGMWKFQKITFTWRAVMALTQNRTQYSADKALRTRFGNCGDSYALGDADWGRRIVTQNREQMLVVFKDRIVLGGRVK